MHEEPLEAERVGEPGSLGAAAAAGAVAGAAVSSAQAVGRASASTFRWLRRSARSGGAGDSGLAALMELSAANAAGDTLVAIALANTVFFAGSVDAARGRVALTLVITMLPFTLLAPVIGPLLDRWGRGRRIALAITMIARAALCWELAGNTGGLAIYPVALGVLVSSRAFNVAKSSAVPRVLPLASTLVRANAKLSVTGVATTVVAAPIGLLLGYLVGHAWVLRLASVVFLGAVVLSLNLPKHVDSPEGEDSVQGLQRALVFGGRGANRLALGALPQALRATCALRWLVGYLTFLLAFQLRGHGHGTTALGFLAIAASAGTALGILLGGRLHKTRPESLIAIGLGISTVACVGGAAAYAVVTAVLVALLVTMAAALGKLSLDAIIQREMAPAARASAFARTETACQIAWVLGAAFGLLPIPGAFAFGIGAAAMAASMAGEVHSIRTVRTRPDHLHPDHRRPDHLHPDHLRPDHLHPDHRRPDHLHPDSS